MNTPALVTHTSNSNLPQWNASAPGYLGLETGGGSGGGGGEGNDRNASQLLTAFRKYWWVVLLIWLVVAVPISIAAYQYIPPQYVAKGAVRASPTVMNPLNKETVTNQFFGEFLRTQVEMMKNPYVLKRAADDVRLKKYRWFAELPDQVRYLDENVTAMSVAQEIYVTMTHKDPEVATVIVDSVIDAYFRSQAELDTQNMEKALGIVKEAYDTTNKSLRDAQKKLESLEIDGGTAWSEANQKVLTESIADAKQTHTKLLTEKINQEAQVEAIKARKAPDEQLYKASIMSDKDPDVERWLAERTKVQMADNILASRKAMPDHPDRVEYRKQLKVLDSKIAQRRKEIQDRAWNEYIASFEIERTKELKKAEETLLTLQSQTTSLQKLIEDQEKLGKDWGNKTQPIMNLREQIANDKEAAKRYGDRINEIENMTRAPGRVTIVGQTVQPRTPTVNKWPKVAAAANGGGLFLGLIVLLILMKLRNKIDQADDLPENFQPLVVGTVSHAQMSGGGAVGGMRRRILGEEMQLLHANLLPPGKIEQRVMMITSPTPANGKTSIASHLALSLAKSGLNVLLIDADLRKRDLTTMFDLGFRPGLSDLMQGNPPELVSPMELLPNLKVMGAGTRLERNPVELLQRKPFHEHLKLLHEKFDCIVIDTPPTLVVADARLIARSCDEVLCVVRANVSSPKEVNQALEALTRITGKAPKIIVNGVAHRQTYYKYKYDYTKDGTEGHSESTTPSGTIG
jgi:capsular exopolysaccharide synthesis family protein